MLEQVGQTMSFWDTSTPNSLNDVDLHKEILLDFGTTNGMSGRIGVFVKTVDKIGGTLHYKCYIIFVHTLPEAPTAVLNLHI